LQALLGVLPDMALRKRVVQRRFCARRPLHVLRRDLRGRVDPCLGSRPQEPAEQLLAVPLPVHPGGIEEVAAQQGRSLEGSDGLHSVRPAPGSPPPNPVTDFADAPAGPAKRAVAHGRGWYTSVPPIPNGSVPRRRQKGYIRRDSDRPPSAAPRQTLQYGSSRM